MNILLIQDDCSVGGHTFLREENARGLGARGHKVTCFFFNDFGYLNTFQKHCEALVGDISDLRRLVADSAFDVVHGDASMIDLPRMLRQVNCHARLVLTRHAVDSPVGWLKRDCHAYLAESATSAALMQPYTDMSVDIVPNGIDTNIFKPVRCRRPDRPIIAWCGRSGAQFKNLPLYLKTTAGLNPDEFEFVVADGDAAGPVEASNDGGGAGQKQVTDAERSHIGTWRRYSRDEFPFFYSRIAVSGGCLLGTSMYEGLPLTILEALACGCPVVAMDSRGVNDVMSGDLRRWLYPPDATPETVRALLLASLPELAQHATQVRLRDHILQNFSVDVMVEENLQAYVNPAKALVCRTRGAGRRALAERLWQHADRTIAEGGRVRNGLHAMRAALRLSPLSILSMGRVAALSAALHTSRLAGARKFIERASYARQHNDPLGSVRETVHALRVHPGVLFTGRTV